MAIKGNKDQPNQGQQHTDERVQAAQAQRDAEERQRQANDTPEQKEEDKRQGKLTSDEAEPHKGETKYFEGTITKIDKDGNTVMSDHLDEGERLRREVTDRYKASGLDPAADQ